jgi:hypothetical protein
MYEISFILEKSLLDVFVLNETKLDHTIDSSDYEINHYHMFRRDRCRHGGSMIVYVKKGILVKSISIDNEAKIIRLVLNVKGPDIGIIACYRPESISSDVFYDKLEQHALKLLSKSSNVVVVGDLNSNLFDTQDSQLCDFMSSYGFHNTISSGTRLKPITKTWTLLDVILTLCVEFFLVSQVFPTSFSDHALVVSAFKCSTVSTSNNLFESRCLTKAKLHLVASALSNYCFDHLVTYDDVNVILNEIKVVIVTILDTIAPVKMIRLKPGGVEWFDGELLKLQKKREYFYNKFLRTKNDVDRAKYVEFRNRFTSRFRTKKADYYKALFVEYGSSSRTLWSKLYPILNPNKKSKLHSVFHGSRVYSAPLEIASLFLSIFSSSLAALTHTPLVNCLRYSRTHFGTHRLRSIRLLNSTCL